MKTVGKQLQEARLAKNWTPELAARETKIKVDRLHDLEADDYSNFTSPTYARGFVRTYARALGLDEYKILRQLDNKLPEDDTSNIVTETGVAYLPETAMPPRVAHRNYAGLYIVTALAGVVALIAVFVLFEAYRVGELSRWFASNPEPAVTNAAPATSTTETAARALPVDSNTPPPIVEETPATNTAPATNVIAEATPAASDTSPAPDVVSPRALPVDPSELTNAAAAAPIAITPPRALPVDPSELTNPASPTPASAPVPPRALPVDPSELTNAAGATPDPPAVVAVNTPAQENGTGVSGTGTSAPGVEPPSPAPTTPAPASSARQSNSGPVMEPSLPPVEPPTASASAPDASAGAATTANSPPQTAAADQSLVLTASQDSFVQVTDLDSPDAEKQLYAAILHSGQSVGFSGHKFSINVGNPSAVDIKLDGVNYGPHSDQVEPETFIVQSHFQ